MLNITEKMLRLSPSERYQTADEVCEDLQGALKEFGVWIERPKPASNGKNVTPPTDFHLLIVDTITNRKNALQEYFNKKHGFRLSFCTEPENAIAELKGRKPPSGILFLADTTRDSVLSVFPEAQAWGRSLKTPCLAVFSADDEDLIRQTITSTKFGTTMFQPATLRDIRLHFETVAAHP
jgi:hypothetical protein